MKNIMFTASISTLNTSFVGEEQSTETQNWENLAFQNFHCFFK